ncbi:uncharacterized protein LOC129718323 isoform X3 [Wyeomyia smithii]|nr:uncharacterized protein LOC129718323 isoform X3 [Wyeomyia smithii]
MILHFYIKHKLTQNALEDLLSMLNALAKRTPFSQSFTLFAKQFPDPYKMERNYFCVNCQFGFDGKPESDLKCPVENCGSMSKDFFIMFQIEHQIRQLYSKYSKEIIHYAEYIETKNIADINRGTLAKSIKTLGNNAVITLSANEDGAAAYKSTNKKPVYPLFLVVNNLPPKIRFNKNNLILASLWFNSGKPNMALFHKKIIIELQKLRNGMSVGTKLYNVVLLHCSLDSVARCELLCSKQFNGRYGCTMCLHPGELVNNQIRYPYQKAKLRQDVDTRKIMFEIQEPKSSQILHGIKGLSVLVGVPDFNIIDGLPVDYMHMALLGVTRTIWELLMENPGDSKNQPYYIGNKKKIIESRLLSIRLPSSFPRRPRRVEEYKKFKASEWETILLHILYPCLSDLLPKSYLNHIMLFATTIFQLLEFSIQEDTLTACEKNLIKFVKDFEKLYGKSYLLYNIHLSLHLVNSDRNLGALWNFSLFPYENGNGMLIGYHTSNNHPVLQLATKFFWIKLFITRVYQLALQFTNGQRDYGIHQQNTFNLILP